MDREVTWGCSGRYNDIGAKSQEEEKDADGRPGGQKLIPSVTIGDRVKTRVSDVGAIALLNGGVGYLAPLKRGLQAEQLNPMAAAGRDRENSRRGLQDGGKS